MTTVVDADNEIIGVFTDGDLRRTIDAGHKIQDTLIKDVMSSGYKYVQAQALAAEAASLMQDSNVYVLIVKDANGHLAGVVKMHDLLQANVL